MSYTKGDKKMKTHTKMTLALLAIMTGTSAQAWVSTGEAGKAEKNNDVVSKEAARAKTFVLQFNANKAARDVALEDIQTSESTLKSIEIDAAYEREGVAQAEVEGLKAVIKALQSKTDTQKAVGVELENKEGELKNQLAEMENGKNGKNA